MTPHQQGRAAFLAGGDRFSSPFPMGSANFASWRNGWNAEQSAAVFARSATRFAQPQRQQDQRENAQ